MKARAVTALVLCALAFALVSAGCAAILEGDTLSTAPHIGGTATAPPGSAPEASTYEELKAAFMELVLQRAESGQVIIRSYDGEIYEDIVRACEEIKTKEPLGAYALNDITATASQFVAYFEVDAELSFRRTKKQIESRITVSTMRYFRTELLGLMSEYESEAVVLTDVGDITAEDVRAAVRELYYENPLAVVVMPRLGIEMFPPDAGDGTKLFELTFDYRWPADMLVSNNKMLRDTVNHIVETVSGGDNDGIILLELARKLADSCVYNEGRAGTLAEHGVRDEEATAFGALLNASAVGEGYAMAFKALCDELGFECHIVLGTLDGAAHAWNIVALEGDYYHVDVAMCSKNGIETAFLLRDADLSEEYQWDREKAKVCAGELTYFDFVEPEETGDEIEGEEAEEVGAEIDVENGGDAVEDTETEEENP